MLGTFDKNDSLQLPLLPANCILLFRVIRKNIVIHRATLLYKVFINDRVIPRHEGSVKYVSSKPLHIITKTVWMSSEHNY